MGRLKLLAMLSVACCLLAAFNYVVLDDFERAVIIGIFAIVAAVLSLAEK